MIARHLIKGRWAERKAYFYLKRKHYRLLEKNFRSRFGEIDLIMQKRSLIIFVEVRYRSTESHGTPADTVTAKKQRKIRLTAECFLIKHRLYDQVNCRFDVIEISPRNLQWHPNAFQINHGT